MPFLPLFHNIKEKPCLVVGGNDVAWRKIQLLQRAGASIVAIAPHFLPVIYESVSAGGGRCLACDFTDEDLLSELVADALSSCVLVISAAEDDDTNVLISALAQMHNIPVNVVDRPELCTFIFPSIVDRGDLTVAVSTGGNAPVMARLLRARLEAWLPSQLSDMVKVAGNARSGLREIFPDPGMRKLFWDALLQESLVSPAGSGDLLLTEEGVLQSAMTFSTTSVSGALDTIQFDHPEPDHVRFFQLRILQAADVLLYESLLPVALRNLARRDAEHICGDMADLHGIAQEKFSEGNRVVIVNYRYSPAQDSADA